MNITDLLTSALRTQGYKLTRHRTAILNFLSEQEKPASAEEILDHIKSEHQDVNKTTVYRELFFLIDKNFIKEIEFGDGKKRYEIAINRPHHHHVICTKCGKVEDIPLEKELYVQEKMIEDVTKFKLTSHMLEFFGVCPICNN